MQWLLILKLLILLAVANGSPVIAHKFFGKSLNQPLDCGVAFLDGRPFFGRSKTIRGIVVSLIATSAFAPVVGFDWISGLTFASVAMVGDLTSSFLKRRFGLSPSSRAIGLDQVPESLFPALAVRSILGLSLFDIILIVIIFFSGEVFFSRLLFKWNIRNRPY
jgi:CDP-diglyceride synthetase